MFEYRIEPYNDVVTAFSVIVDDKNGKGWATVSLLVGNDSIVHEDIYKQVGWLQPDFNLRWKMMGCEIVETPEELRQVITKMITDRKHELIANGYGNDSHDAD